MIRLEDVTLFVRSAALGSFSSAAREAGLLPGQVSAAVHRLERDLDKDAAGGAGKVDRRLVERRFLAVEIAHEVA